MNADASQGVWTENSVNADVPMQAMEVLVMTTGGKDIKKAIEELRPMLLIGNLDGAEPETLVELYTAQIQGGRYYLHESTSGRDSILTKFADLYEDHFATSKAGSRWVTNSGCLAESIQKHCGENVFDSDWGEKYSKKFKTEVMRALGGQLEADLQVRNIDQDQDVGPNGWDMDILQCDEENDEATNIMAMCDEDLQDFEAAKALFQEVRGIPVALKHQSNH